VDEKEYPVPAEIKSEFDRAKLLQKRNEHTAALKVLLGLLDQYPEEPRLLISAASSYVVAGYGLEEAEGYFLKALDCAPHCLSVLICVSSYYGRLKQYEKAAEYARRAIRVDTRSAAPWIVLGLYYARKGEIETGLDYFRAAYSRGDDKILSAFNIGCALTELGRFKEALEYLTVAISDQNTHARAKIDPSLDSLRELPEFKRIMSEAEQWVSCSRYS